MDLAVRPLLTISFPGLPLQVVHLIPQLGQLSRKPGRTFSAQFARRYAKSRLEREPETTKNQMWGGECGRISVPQAKLIASKTILFVSVFDPHIRSI